MDSLEVRKIKNGIANDKYNILLQSWQRESRNGTLQKYPDYFGGAYIDDDNNLVIMLTDSSESIKTGIGNIIDLTGVLFKEARYSLAELSCARDGILKEKATANNELYKYIVATGISQSKNAVNLYICLPPDCADENLFIESLKSSVTDFEGINVIISGPDMNCSSVLLGSAITNSYWVDNIQGGQAKSATRSVGFWAIKDGNYGIVTAPHDIMFKGNTITIGSQTFGVADEPNYTNNGTIDAIFVRRTNSDFSASNTIDYWNSSLSTTNYGNPAEGSDIYGAGERTGKISGKVVDNCYSVSTDNITITDCVLTDALCNNGDSGGTVFSQSSTLGYLIAGIVKAKKRVPGSEDFKNDPGYMIYCKYKNIIDGLGVTRYLPTRENEEGSVQ